METHNQTQPGAEYLPPHAYANWLILAARVVLEPYQPERADPPVTPAEIEEDRAAWRQWAEEKLRRSEEPSPPPARGTSRARRIGHMLDAEPDRSGAHVEGYTTTGVAELFSVAIRRSARRRMAAD